MKFFEDAKTANPIFLFKIRFSPPLQKKKIQF